MGAGKPDMHTNQQSDGQTEENITKVEGKLEACWGQVLFGVCTDHEATHENCTFGVSIKYKWKESQRCTAD